jgi:NAD(P)-dependent dehydrogenase (short-subunit alcohol dehydrogenase family)
MDPIKVALVTGGNRGMGLETCRELATSADAKRSGGYFFKRELIDW